MEKSKPLAKFKKPAYFRPDTLIFSESRHALGISDRHYRCVLSSHKKCNANGERQIPKETMERTFGRYAGRFFLEKKPGQLVTNEILKKELWNLITGIDEQAESEEEIMTSTTEVMLQDAISDKKIQQSDIEDFEKAYVRSQEADYPLMLCGFVLNFVKVASHPENEAMLGRNLAILTKHVEITKSGSIVAIELEPWGWYAMNYIERYSPGYLQGLKDKKVKILNTQNEFLKMPLHEAALKYGIGYTQDAMGQDMNVTYGLFRFVKDTLKISLNLEPEQMSVAIPYLFDRMQNDPAIRIATQAMGLLKIKPLNRNKP
jgi:hypothetical protein